MQIINTRTGDEIRIKRSQRLFARERETMDVAYPGDVVGLVIPGQFRLGDTLCERGRLRYQGQWEFPPECFATLRCTDTSRRKQFDKGLRQLVEEGAIQVLLDARGSLQEPIVAAVGQLQFEVTQYRLESEYNARAALQPLPYRFARWVAGEPNELAELRLPSSTRRFRDETGMTVLLFESEGMLNYCKQLNPRLSFHEVRPSGGNEPANS
jgi:peptide chain release factor 3